ncbi:MAG: hypothetical protein KatS3mg108_2780 [Isosphaeraceae bacterium]|jgi:YkoY family integral membrane protein|nr:MAG: hypothetical protein KatS3mg108_2780 [Isosphaeraceae bacterium]
MEGIDWSDIASILPAILSLVLLEGLLSADNALVLAVMVQHLPKHQQKRALRYGIWGAFFFRLIAVIFAYQLIQFWQLKLLGGMYLVFLAIKHFGGGHEEPSVGEVPKRRFGQGFWATVVNVELADIAFSIDSILAAVAMVEGLPEDLQRNQTLALGIIYVGGILGIVMMRLVAGGFLVILNKYPGLASGAYFLVGWIGLKLVGSGMHAAFHAADYQLTHELLPAITGGVESVATQADPVKDWRDLVPRWIRTLPWEIDDRLFWAGMALIVVASLLYRPRRRRRLDGEPGPLAEVVRTAEEGRSPGVGESA